MQIFLTLRPENQLVIPLSYNYQLQSALYSLLGKIGESGFWHDFGFVGASRYKGFCFGELKGKYTFERESNKRKYHGDVSLEIRGHSFEFIDTLQRAIETYPRIKLFDTDIEITAASLGNRHFSSGRRIVETETPVVIHKTLADGFVDYATPDVSAFYYGICGNAAKKFETITGDKADEMRIRPAGEFKKTVAKYKGSYINGYTGAFEIDTSIKMLEFLYNTGLGEKNSQGFGFIKNK